MKPRGPASDERRRGTPNARVHGDVLVDDTLVGLAEKMNVRTGTDHERPEVLQATADAFDANFAAGANCTTTTRSALSCVRGNGGRTGCAPASPRRYSSAAPGRSSPRMQRITRKSLGGLQTDLQSRVLDAAGAPIHGFYAVGEAAGFGGGGASGKRSLAP